MAVRFNTQFSQFVQFALRQMDAGNAKTIARYGDGGVLLGWRAITAAKGDRVDAPEEQMQPGANFVEGGKVIINP